MPERIITPTLQILMYASFTSLGCYLAFNDETNTKDTIFLSSQTKETSASQKYCQSWQSSFKKWCQRSGGSFAPTMQMHMVLGKVVRQKQ